MDCDHFSNDVDDTVHHDVAEADPDHFSNDIDVDNTIHHYVTEANQDTLNVHSFV